jgi:hypothetical protein
MKMTRFDRPVVTIPSRVVASASGNSPLRQAVSSGPDSFQAASGSAPKFGGKPGFWGKAWLLTPLLGLGSWLGESHLETRPVAHARTAMDKHSQELVAMDQLRQREENPVARINYELMLQKEILRYVATIGENISRNSGEKTANPADSGNILGQIGLTIDEIRFTRTILENVSQYQGAEQAEKLYNVWLDRVLAKRVDAPTLEKRRTEAKSFFSAMAFNKQASEVLWIAMLASFTSFGLITVGGTLKGLFGSDEGKPKG